MMLLKSYIQHARKLENSSGQRTGKVFSVFSVFILIPKKSNVKECWNNCTIILISHASKEMLKILKARLQQASNWELPDVLAGFRKGRGTRGQIVDIHWITQKSKELQNKKRYFCFIDYTKTFNCVDHNKLENSSRDGGTRPPHLPPENSVCKSRNNSLNRTWNNRLVPNWERSMSGVCTVTLLI